MEGSYSLSDDNFKGKITFPSIDRQKNIPGDGWELLKDSPSPNELPIMQIILCQPEMDKLPERIGSRQISNS